MRRRAFRETGGLNAVNFGNGMFTAVGGTSSVAWSKDGLKWRRFDDAKGNPTTLSREIDFGKTHLYGVVFHGGKFYALGNGDLIVTLVPGANGLTLEGSVMKGMITSRLNDMVVVNGKAVVVGTTEDYSPWTCSSGRRSSPGSNISPSVTGRESSWR